MSLSHTVLRAGTMAAVLALAACERPHKEEDDLQAVVAEEGGLTSITLPARALRDISTAAAPASYEWTADGNVELQALGLAIDAARLPDGRVVVLDAMGDLLHVLSEDGEVIGTWGGHGEGPDRFQGVARLIVWSDSLAVVDHGGVRPSHVDHTGLISRGAFEIPQEHGYRTLLARTEGGEWVFGRSREAVAGDETTVDTLLLSVVALNGVSPYSADSLGEFVQRLAMLRSSPTMITMVKLPYSPSGSVRANGSWIALHSGLDYTVHLIDRQSGQRVRISFDSVPAPLAGSARASIVEAALADVPTEQRSPIERVWQNAPWPAREGGFIGAYPDGAGGVWLGLASSPSALVGSETSHEVWVHLDQRGERLHSFRLQPRERLLTLHGAAAVVLARDLNGVQSIRLLRP